ncbi:MAG: selenoprotein B glycine/betaine/sarcosine/D-proline reductase [Myxococcales bacterium]|nr:selenoprotein B glycine/betaine/sarcosine/D-proline reductase [Myxococcales bacterium]
MARMKDLDPGMQKHLLALECPTYAKHHFVKGGPLSERRVAIISTAGLHMRGDPAFGVGATDYRIIPGSASAGELVMSHISSNFDRTGFQHDYNVVFPLDRLKELAEEGLIGSVAKYHYSFMGATDPKRMEPAALELAEQLRADRVDALLLVPV